MTKYNDLTQEKSIIDKLKENLEGWELSLKVRDSARKSANFCLKEKLKEVKELKRTLYLTTKEWREAKKEIKKAKYKLSTCITQKRAWGKKNLGKVFNNILELKQ